MAIAVSSVDQIGLNPMIENETTYIINGKKWW